jgi:hypothetical protein
LLLDKERNAVVKDYDSLFYLSIVIGNALNDMENNLPLKEEPGYDKEVIDLSEADFQKYIDILKPFLQFYITHFQDLESFGYIIEKI